MVVQNTALTPPIKRETRLIQGMSHMYYIQTNRIHILTVGGHLPISCILPISPMVYNVCATCMCMIWAMFISINVICIELYMYANTHKSICVEHVDLTI